MERWFHLSERSTSVATELRAGATTFLAMSYIIFVQPAVLSIAGLDFGAVLVATCLSAALATAIMGLWANYPIAQAPLMGENFFFAFGVVGLMGIPWPTALGIVFLSGVLFLGLTFARVREAILDAVPPSLKAGIAAGIGIFVAFIGLTQGGLVVKRPAPGAFLQIGDLASPVALVTLAGLAAGGVLVARRTRGALLAGMVVAAGLAAGAGLVRIDGVVAAPPSLAPTLLALDIAGAVHHPDLILVFLFMLVFDTVGTLIGVSEQAGLTRDGRLPRAERALVSDAVGTVAGAVLGTSTVSSYIESAAGVADGARTGLANLATAALFLGAIFFAPLVASVGGGVEVDGLRYYPVTAPAIVLVGCFMMGMAKRIDWDDLGEAVPAFLTIVAIPFTFNIAHGVACGIVSHVLVSVGTGRARRVSWLMWGLAATLVACYIALPRLRH